MSPDQNVSAVRKLRQILRVVMGVSGVLTLVILVTITAYPLVFWACGALNVLALISIYRLDRAIVRKGGKSFWSGGRFQDE